MTAPVPCRVWLDRGVVRVVDAAGVDPSEAFFADTIRRMVVDLGRTPTDVDLDGWQPVGPGPRGSLLHVGRCGSTLLTRMLEAALGIPVVREAPAGTDLTGAWGQGRPGDVVAGLWRRVAAAFGSAFGAPVLLKHTSWEALFARELAPALDAPVVALVREPVAVVRSLLDQPPSWVNDLWSDPATMQRGYPGLLEAAGGPVRTAVDWYTALWTATVRAMLELPGGEVLFVDYDDLVRAPAAVVAAVAPHLGCEVASEGLTERLAAVAATYAKGRPGEVAPFDPEGPHRRPPLADATRERVERGTASEWAAARARIADGAGRIR